MDINDFVIDMDVATSGEYTAIRMRQGDNMVVLGIAKGEDRAMEIAEQNLLSALAGLGEYRDPFSGIDDDGFIH